MDRRAFLRIAASAPATLHAVGTRAQAAASKPNIIVILAGDIGYGGTGLYGAARVKTPNLEKLAARGLRFTNAYCSPATHTPVRYSLLAGRYAFRREGFGIPLDDASLPVEPGQLAIASVLQVAGYATGIASKWHPGFENGNTDWDGVTRPSWAGYGYMESGRAARWMDDGTADALTRKASEFIDASANKPKPFFLCFAASDIHASRSPNPRFTGKSECGIRRDATVQFDWSAGQILEAIDRNGIAGNTLVIFTGDADAAIDNGHEDGAREDLNGRPIPSPLRGGKYGIDEGGTRVPFIVYWPARVKPGISDAPVSQVDLLASLAALAGASILAEAGSDGLNRMRAILGESNEGRPHGAGHNNAAT